MEVSRDSHPVYFSREAVEDVAESLHSRFSDWRKMGLTLSLVASVSGFAITFFKGDLGLSCLFLLSAATIYCMRNHLHLKSLETQLTNLKGINRSLNAAATLLQTTFEDHKKEFEIFKNGNTHLTETSNQLKSQLELLNSVSGELTKKQNLLGIAMGEEIHIRETIQYETKQLTQIRNELTTQVDLLKDVCKELAHNASLQTRLQTLYSLLELNSSPER